MDNNSILKTYLVVLGVCLVSSYLVSTAVVKLRPRQNFNQRLAKDKHILKVAGLYAENTDIDAVFQQNIEKHWIELKTGKSLNKSIIDFDKFSINALAKHPEYGEKIPAKEDIARIKRRPNRMPVYFVKKANKRTMIILPVYGKGLWSTLYGFLALKPDIKTIAGISFYQQGETPGLGGEISNPHWQRLWQGKQAFDARGQVAIRVIKGTVKPDTADAIFQVDGLSGATLTSRGVNDLVHYWLGSQGYGPFLKRLKDAGNI